MTNIQYHTSTSIHILYNNTLPVFYQRKWWNNTNAITFGQIYSLLRNSVITFRIGAFVPSRTTLRRVDKQPTDPVRSASSVEYTDQLTFFILSRRRGDPVPCGLLRRVCDNNKTHYSHSWSEKSCWVDWPSLARRVKFSAPPSFRLLHLSVRDADTGSVFSY